MDFWVFIKKTPMIFHAFSFWLYRDPFWIHRTGALYILGEVSRYHIAFASAGFVLVVGPQECLQGLTDMASENTRDV